MNSRGKIYLFAPVFLIQYLKSHFIALCNELLYNIKVNLVNLPTFFIPFRPPISSWHILQSVFDSLCEIYIEVQHLPLVQLIMDNASIHKKLTLDRSTNVIYTPPYSPEYQPIELCFSQVKRNVRNIWKHVHMFLLKRWT